MDFTNILYIYLCFRMKLEKEYYQHLLQFFEDKGLKATEVWHEIITIYGKDAISECNCWDWYVQEG